MVDPSPKLLSISIVPDAAYAGLGSRKSFSAYGNYDNGETLDITSSVVWSEVNGTGSAIIGIDGTVDTLGGARGSVIWNSVSS